ncbi:MAG TPA: response regulator transcription factor [Mycobacteriales bacterium]|nr:response regulator transcription factor [Mycobacteriales bacterium]
MDRISVYVCATDPVSRAGVASQLRPRPEVEVVDHEGEPDAHPARTAVVVADSVDEDTVRLLRRVQRSGCRTVLVPTRVDDAGLAAAVEAGVAGLVRRADATPERLARAVCAAGRGEGTVPPDLLGRLLDQVGKLQRQVLHPRGLTFTGLATREIEVLRLVADGYDTAEIARTLSYSERTVKNVLHDVTTRLHLRNRSHAVAYALRQGLI